MMHVPRMQVVDRDKWLVDLVKDKLKIKQCYM